MKTVLILGITSDIGRELAARFERDHWRVVGTYRGTSARGLTGLRNRTLIACDLSSAASVDRAAKSCRRRKLVWDLLVVAAGTEEPIGAFVECDADEWEKGISVNALAPLRFLRGVYGLRRRRKHSYVAMFSGSGTNSAVPAYSAYCSSKILLIKMAELLDAEAPETAFFVIGPGIVRTKIHLQTLASPVKSGRNYRKVVDFLSSGDQGTSHDDIYSCILWCMAAGKAAVGGRNIALAHDDWRDRSSSIASALKSDGDLYRLRRHGNNRKFVKNPK